MLVIEAWEEGISAVLHLCSSVEPGITGIPIRRIEARLNVPAGKGTGQRSGCWVQVLNLR